MSLSPAEREARKTSVGKRSARYAGMTDKSTWRRSKVHAATSYYGCAFCSVRFADPGAIYTHISKRHPHASAAGVYGAFSRPPAALGVSA